MNKRIKQLAEHARAQVHEIYKTMEEEPIGNFIDWFDEQFEQKFAELMIVEFSDIVKETATRVAQTAFSDGEDAVAVQKRVAGALRVLDVMRERFGVEE